MLDCGTRPADRALPDAHGGAATAHGRRRNHSGLHGGDRPRSTGFASAGVHSFDVQRKQLSLVLEICEVENSDMFLVITINSSD